MIANKKDITLPDGTVTDNYSEPYMRWCEALNLSKKPLHKRKEFLSKLKDEQRVNKLKYWLQIIWQQNK